MKEEKIPIFERIRQAAGGMEMPLSMVAGMPRIQMIGNREIIIENHKGILEYGTEEMRINCGKWIVKITGEELELKQLNLSELSISGMVLSVEFIN